MALAAAAICWGEYADDMPIPIPMPMPMPIPMPIKGFMRVCEAKRSVRS